MPITIEEAWNFFSTPLNLNKITPPDVNFKQTSLPNPDGKMYPGQIITYKISPISGVYVNWVTEITHVKELSYFVDEQRSGPFSLFHHEHHFKVIPGGVEMTDILSYAVPLSFLGRLVNRIFVGNKLEEVFGFRKQQIDDLFGEFKSV